MNDTAGAVVVFDDITNKELDMLFSRLDLITGRVLQPRIFRLGLNATGEEEGGTPAPPPANTYYWADGTLANGAAVENGAGIAPPNSSETRYVNFALANGSSDTISGIDGGIGGEATIIITFAYDNNSGPRTGELVINGVAQPITFESTGAFNIWEERSIVVTLNAGTGNTIALRSTGADLANVHGLYVSPKTVPDPPPPPPPPAPAPVPTPSPPPPSPPPPAPAPGMPQTLQAEDGVLTGGVLAENTNGQPTPNFTGTGYVNFPLSGGKVEWTLVDGGTGGSARIDIRYAYDGNSGTRVGVLRVNGSPQNISYPSTGGWDNYVEIQVYVTLTAGATNTISLESNGQDCGNVDRIYVVPNTSAPPVLDNNPYTLQAEDGVLSGGATAENGNGPGFTGTGYVNFPPSGGKVEFTGQNGGTINQTCAIDVTYSYDGNSGTRVGVLRVNGTAYTLTTPSTGSWNNYLTLRLYVAMTAGPTNTISIESTGIDLANIDKLDIYPGVSGAPTPPPPEPPAPTPPPPPPPPAPAGSIDAGDIFALINPNLPFASQIGGWGAEWDNNKKTGVASLSNTIGQGALADSTAATGSLGRVRIGKQLAPENDGRYVLAIRGYKGDGLTAGAPRTECSVWITQPGIIPVKQDFWFAFGVYLSQGFPITNEFCMCQWHTNGSSPAGYAGQPFWGIYLVGNQIRVQNRWNANSTLSGANTSSQVYTLTGIPVNTWVYFVVKARISPTANNNPYMQMWRADSMGGLSQVINSTNPLGYTGYDNGDPPWQKFGHYPYGHDTFNVWNAPLTRELFYRCPVFVDDPTSKYLPIDLLNYVRTR